MKLSTDQVGRIAALYRVRGATPATVSTVAKTWNITEAEARDLGKAATTKPPKPSPRAVTEAGEAVFAAPAGGNVHKQVLASRLADEVNAAESKIAADNGSLASLSLSQLESLSAAWGG
jgi:lysozyme family protein